MKKKKKIKYFIIVKLCFWFNNLVICDRWVKKWGFNDIGFGREKIIYCYFVIVILLFFEFVIKVGKFIVKIVIFIIVVDDLFDEEGFLDDLEVFIKVVIR